MCLNAKYCAWRWLLLLLFPMLTLVACGDDDGSASAGSAVWRGSSSVGEAEGSAAIQITGPLGAAWEAEIESDARWCSFRINDPDARTAQGTVSPSAIDNILDIYYTQNDSSQERTARISFRFVGGEPQTLILRQHTSSATDDPYVEGHARAWAELPARAESAGYVYVSHFASLGGRSVRNYSYCYDPALHVARWVAYPLHAVYRGTVDRTNEFAYDPKIDYSWQPDLGSGSYRGSYDRGHQLPSADRTATRDLNLQTFYATNMTPQLDRLNQDMWARLETKVRNQMCSDTLYVVTGCYYASTTTTTTDRNGLVCPVPTNYFKVLLRTRNGQTGKRIADCSADELKSIGFWVDQRSYGDIEPPASVCRSVAEIEELTGFTFFPNLSEAAAEAVKSQNAPAQWGIQ
ncbi:MAG: DNA/RNA non-specific endonuclease [Alistipes sp.]|nr:DNA/RNA non-specific endonuclease [Alistipes sp.]